MTARTTGSGSPFEINEKRFYLEGYVLTVDCDYCGCEIRTDFASDYLSYPTANEPFTYYVQECWQCGCECYARDDYEQQSVVLMLSVSLEVAPGDTPC